ncbi:GNAT family N-acetyltransferase [Burkholderia ubonensis]|uniref:GNAT family N-acetyltransferase n=1 Tax=Burkholderia ubonensis TaxID=101571 RepID=UPI0009B43488|nr:GNAT family N-acetyltransferase [Burkholderia ubonensis]
MRKQLQIESGMPASAFLDAAETAFADSAAMQTPLLSAAYAWAARPWRGDVRAWLAWRGDTCAGAALLGPGGELDHAGSAADADAWAATFGSVLAGVRWLAGERLAVAALLRALRGHGWRSRRMMMTEVLAIDTPDALPPSADVRGAYGVAVERDSEQLSFWLRDFIAETRLSPIERPDRAVSALIARGDLRVWRVDGVPVSMIAVVARTRRATRCSLVYTPPALRRRGYAHACTGATTRTLLAEACGTCCVHVRIADAAARSLYASLGYQGLGFRVEGQCSE